MQLWLNTSDFSKRSLSYTLLSGTTKLLQIPENCPRCKSKTVLRCYQSTLANQTVQHSTAIFTVPSHLRFHPCKCQSSSVWKLQARRRRGAPPLACIFTVFKPGECCSVIMLCNTDRSSKRCKQRSGVLGLGVRNVTNSILMQQNEHQSQNASLKYMLTTQMTRTQSRPSCQYDCGEPRVKVG